jgi:hypothetical protein
MHHKFAPSSFLQKIFLQEINNGHAGPPDIFQGKMSELMGFLENAQANLDDLLCISRNSLKDHLEYWTRSQTTSGCGLKSQR